jgi:hypothetical protein
MAQDRNLRHDTMERLTGGLWTLVLAASVAGWVFTLFWIAYLLMALDGSREQ